MSEYIGEAGYNQPDYNENTCYGCGGILRGSSYCPKCRDGFGELAPPPVPGWFAVGYQNDGTKHGALISVGPCETEAEALEQIAANNLHGLNEPGYERVPFVFEVEAR
jgi:hypothetical protein